jgi:hypothetical protein
MLATAVVLPNPYVLQAPGATSLMLWPADSTAKYLVV